MSNFLPLPLAERLNNGEYDATTHMIDEGLSILTTASCQYHEILKGDLNEEDRAYYFAAQKLNQSKIHNINNIRRASQPPSPEETKKLIELMEGLMNEPSVENSLKADVQLVPVRSTRSTDYMTTDGVNFVAVKKNTKEKETEPVNETDSVKNADDTESDNDTTSSYVPSSSENSSGESSGSSGESSGSSCVKSSESTQDTEDSWWSSLSK